MATRLNKRQTQSARDLIQVEKICKSLQAHVDGEYMMRPTQINAARILLDKSMPSLTATAVSDDRDEAMPVLNIVRRS
jgi:hypothetical protein